MNRCPNSQRRIDGKCVYKDLYEDCKDVANRFNRSGRYFSQLKKDVYRLNETYALDEDAIAERLSLHMLVTQSNEKLHWDDVYYVVLGAGGDGW